MGQIFFVCARDSARTTSRRVTRVAIQTVADLQAAVNRILAACHKASKEALIFAGRKEDKDRYFAQGFDSVALGLDAMVLLEAYRDLLK